MTCRTVAEQFAISKLVQHHKSKILWGCHMHSMSNVFTVTHFFSFFIFAFCLLTVFSIISKVSSAIDASYLREVVPADKVCVLYSIVN